MKDFSYAQKKAQKKNKKPWYVIPTKKYGGIYLWGLPLLPILIFHEKFSNWMYARREWSEAKATKVLDYALPHTLEWVEDDKAYFFCMEWRTNFKNYVPFYLKKWASKFNFKIGEYLLHYYEKDGYIKTVEKDEYTDTWIKFEKGA